MAIQDLLNRANERLKSGRIGVMLEVQEKGNWLYLKGTLPPRIGSQQGKLKQTRIALKLQALDAKSIKSTEVTARQVGLDLNRGLFDWRKWSDYPGVPSSKSITANACGYARISNSTTNPAPATFTYNGTNYTTASLTEQVPNRCIDGKKFVYTP